jgi:pectate lyase C
MSIRYMVAVTLIAGCQESADTASSDPADETAEGRDTAYTADGGIGPGPCGCETPAGEYGIVSSTIVVESKDTYDGECQVFRADPEALGDGSQEEGQKPIFRVNGGTLKNIVIDHSGADGIHIYGDATLENIHWLDIGEDALTVKEPATLRLDCGSSQNGEDKTFQINAESTVYISNFTARSAGKLVRQNGGTEFPISVYIDHCDIAYMDESIFRTDSSESYVEFTNSLYSSIGEGLFLFGDDIVNDCSNHSQCHTENIRRY